MCVRSGRPFVIRAPKSLFPRECVTTTLTFNLVGHTFRDTFKEFLEIYVDVKLGR